MVMPPEAFKIKYSINEIKWWLNERKNPLKEWKKNGWKFSVKKFNPFLPVIDLLLFTVQMKRTFKGFNVPVLEKDDTVWMSLMPMEVQTAYLPIKRAKGVVGTGGLGLGYFTRKVAEKPEVSKVIVYEIDADIIELYYSMFDKHPKIEIIQKDVKEVENEKFDFFFMDIYDTAGPDAILTDSMKFRKKNEVLDYWGWSMEVLLAPAVTGSFDWFSGSSDISFNEDLEVPKWYSFLLNAIPYFQGLVEYAEEVSINFTFDISTSDELKGWIGYEYD